MGVCVSVREFAEALGMTVSVNARPEFTVEISDINFPGLQFAGYFNHFVNDRVQLAGNAEMGLLAEYDVDMMRKRLETYFSYPMPVLVISRGNKVPPLMAECAKNAQVPILRSPLTTTKCSHRISNYLDDLLAPQITRHGVLVDVYGVGIMLIGESGIGKSETALELVKRGHRLVADDVVEIRQVSENCLIGSSPELIRYLMELRGIGIIDVRNMYGVGAVMINKQIDMIIELEEWIEDKQYDRLGLVDSFQKMLDVNLPYLNVPVRPGRNLAIIVEVAARNYRLKNMGFNAAQELDRRMRGNETF